MAETPTIKPIRKVCPEAIDAFWKVVLSHYPDLTSGDFPPNTALEFELRCRQVIAEWITWNLDRMIK